MESEAYERIAPQAVRSSKGFIVRFTGRSSLEYSEGDHRLSLYVESCGGRESISVPAIPHWEPPHQNEEIPLPRWERMKWDIVDAVNALGCKAELHYVS